MDVKLSAFCQILLQLFQFSLFRLKNLEKTQNNLKPMIYFIYTIVINRNAIITNIILNKMCGGVGILNTIE